MENQWLAEDTLLPNVEGQVNLKRIIKFEQQLMAALNTIHKPGACSTTSVYNHAQEKGPN